MKVASRQSPISLDASRSRGDALVAWIRDYAERRIDSRLIDERRSIPPHVVLDMGRAGLFGLQVEEKYGGLALRHRDAARILEQFAAVDLALGTFLLTSLYPGIRPIAAFGSTALKDEVLPDLAAGRLLAGYAQTEPDAGTHFAAMQARAVARPDNTWLLSGNKVWIGNSSWAGVLTVMAQEIATDGRRRGLSAFAVRVDQPGVVLGSEILSLGMRGMVQGEVSFHDVPIDGDHVVGSPRGGLEVGVDSMSYSRFAIAATCLGSMRRCAQLALRFASRRSIATGRLLDHPLTRATLFEMGARIAALESLLYSVADALDAGDEVAAELLAACKIAGSEFCWKTADETVQLLGSRGYDEATGVPQMLRDARVTRIFEGATEPLMAFLGAAAATPRSDLCEALSASYGATAIADRLALAAENLRDREPGVGGPGDARAWRAAIAGDAALFATLLAAHTFSGRHDNPTNNLTNNVTTWLEQRFESACQNAERGDPREALMTTSAQLESQFARLTEPIGDVETSTSGERRTRDPLLRR